MQKLTADQFFELQNSSFIIDTRQPEIFARCYIKDSVNIPGEGAFCGWAGMVVPHDKDIILIVENEETVLEIVQQLKLIAITKVVGYMVWDRNLKTEMDSLELLPVKDLASLKDVLIVDVRTMPEWKMGHIQKAEHKELSDLKDWIKDLPSDVKIATICGSGYRSSIAASILQKNGYEDVASIQGGMQAWKKANFPIHSEHY